MELRDSVGIVVGAGSVLGEVVALGLAAEGMTLDLVDARGRGLPDLASRLQAATDAPVVAREIDLRSATGIGEVLDGVVQEYGRIDLLVEIVDLPRTPGLVRDAPEAWDEVVDGTFRSVHLFCREGARRMLPRQRGRIIVLCPCPGSRDAYEGALSAAVREAIAGLCRELQRELRREGIRVDCIRHGPVETPAGTEHGSVVERLVRPEEVGRAVLWFATSEPDVRVDGLALFACDP